VHEAQAAGTPLFFFFLLFDTVFFWNNCWWSTGLCIRSGDLWRPRSITQVWILARGDWMKLVVSGLIWAFGRSH
jgi:hypothetical protein